MSADVLSASVTVMRAGWNVTTFSAERTESYPRNTGWWYTFATTAITKNLSGCIITSRQLPLYTDTGKKRL